MKSRDKKNKHKTKKTSSISFLFCPEVSCSLTFENENEYENHLMTGNHTSVPQKSAMDKVRTSFVKKMKTSSAAHQVHSSTNVTICDMTMSSALEKESLFAKVVRVKDGLSHR